MTENIDLVEDFLDLLENKYAIRIKIEANRIGSPKRQIRAGMTYRSESLAGMLREAIELYRKFPSMYKGDLDKVIRAVKAHGVYEETEGLPRMYQECMGKFNKQLKDYQILRIDFDRVSDAWEELKIKKKNLEDENEKLKLENATLKMKVEGT